MPIKIPNSLPATEILENENIFVMTEHRAMHQDIRPLRVLILNLMPTKIVTETQLLRKLSNTPLQIEVEFLKTASYIPHNYGRKNIADHCDAIVSGGTGTWGYKFRTQGRTEIVCAEITTEREN